ncbi:DNA-directed RNA polymerase subunit delta [Mycoplasma feriruminatoris]|uniref:RNAP delta factor n=1 Tax=Mycoplasma feriruminatoris TaxID=1179777 RepID=A0AAQ3HWG6_9MOLU|nr:DNA-directed RNA polymerase subunit delta [Mycoplasma feriruminatoris]UKS53796.1 DNA-directed RNA polymerase delta subunit [Mycoplasma feriruminatoris]WFQ89893.1 DNA-directed RNA polymerase subunit delta [Mycoplasma feriruminatoris]WFQ90714.1 DNA-directed RNA polymerase subunit delta [Mycoplasma feriruminatoris]WFQ91535.1 DNA-directed RNA polymerase subunit delta [Mycoplasma feriruminatoris]WFQ94887.1 DNA-directed RNA polymerase subunit delta [Mycoplasma feriruminatoris]
MSKVRNLDLVYSYLQSTKTPSSLNEIWKSISKDIISQKKDEISVIADLYGDMVLDNRFALTTDNLWALSSNSSVENIKKQYDDFINSSDHKHKYDDSDEELTIDDEMLLDEDYDNDDFTRELDDFDEDFDDTDQTYIDDEDEYNR